MVPPIVIWPIVAWIVFVKLAHEIARRLDPLLANARRHDDGREEQRRADIRGGVDPERERQRRAEGSDEHGRDGIADDIRRHLGNPQG